MERVGATLVAQPDRDHLEQAALDGTAEVRVRLDPIDRDDDIRLVVGVAIHEDRDPSLDLADPDRLQA